MLVERTIIDQIEICHDGVVRIRFAIQILKDGEIISNNWHRTAIPPEVPSDLQLGAVQEDFRLNGKPLFDQKEFGRVKAFCQLNSMLLKGAQNESVQTAASGAEQSGEGPLV